MEKLVAADSWINGHALGFGATISLLIAAAPVIVL
jgi:hypothetical protein